MDVADDEEDSDIDSDEDVDDVNQEGDKRLPEPAINGVPTPLFDDIEPTVRKVRITVNRFRQRLQNSVEPFTCYVREIPKVE